MFLKNHVHLPGIVLCALSLLTAGKLLESREIDGLKPKNLNEALQLLIEHPDDYSLYHRISGFYLEKANYKRSRFFHEEATRLAQIYGDGDLAFIEYSTQ